MSGPCPDPRSCGLPAVRPATRAVGAALRTRVLLRAARIGGRGAVGPSPPTATPNRTANPAYEPRACAPCGCGGHPQHRRQHRLHQPP
eukprot:scaffold4806_cov363-Prasinococcus_capsulatus_cf.AAC.1